MSDNTNLPAEDITAESEWQIIPEQRVTPWKNPVDGTYLTYETQLLKRTDGFTVEHVGMNREKWETFVAKGSFGEFKFIATRWDQCNDKPSDTYIVHTQASTHFETTFQDQALCLSHAKDIESALLQFPVGIPFFNQIAVKSVVFDIGDKPTKPKYVKSNDV